VKAETEVVLIFNALVEIGRMGNTPGRYEFQAKF